MSSRIRFCYYIVFFTLLWSSLKQTEAATGVFELVPNGAVLACPGKLFEVMCTTNESVFLQWNITIPYYEVTDTRVISSTNTARSITPLEVHSTFFTFEITSISPLTSTLLIDTPTAYLNGTRIHCTERDSDIDRSSMIVLHIINKTEDYVHTTGIKNRTVEEFGIDNVTVVLEMITDSDGLVSNTINVIPQPLAVVWLIGNSIVQLTVMYNTPYYVTVVTTVCDQILINQNTINKLNYPRCEEPIVTSNVTLDYNSTLLGSQLLFWCKDGLLPNEVIVAECIENAVWKPNPSGHVCSNTVTSLENDVVEMIQNWILIGICISLGSLLGIILLIVSIVTITKLCRKGSRHIEREMNAKVEDEAENDIYSSIDIDVSRNTAYCKIVKKNHNITVNENVAYCSTHHTTSEYIYIQNV